MWWIILLIVLGIAVVIAVISVMDSASDYNPSAALREDAKSTLTLAQRAQIKRDQGQPLTNVERSALEMSQAFTYLQKAEIKAAKGQHLSPEELEMLQAKDNRVRATPTRTAKQRAEIKKAQRRPLTALDPGALAGHYAPSPPQNSSSIPVRSSPPSGAQPVTCPKCSSTQITAQKRGWKKGRTIGMATVGLFLIPGGILWGAAGAIGRKKIEVTCINCGHSWIAGKA